jgi:hypothetical protein
MRLAETLFMVQIHQTNFFYYYYLWRVMVKDCFISNGGHLIWFMLTCLVVHISM